MAKGAGTGGGLGRGATSNPANGPAAVNPFAPLENSDRGGADDLNSPYYLASSDNPGWNLVSSPLTGSNYNSWSRAMRMALVAKNKLGFVDGSVEKPRNHDSLFINWARCNSMVMSWILHAVSKEIANSVMYIDNAVDMWKDLHDRFHQNNGPRIFQIKQMMSGLTLGNSDVSGYFTRLKTLWDELREFWPIPVCNCGGMKDWEDSNQQDYVLQFLIGLNESYSQIRAQILMMEPLPHINRVFSLVIQEERQRNLTGTSIPPISAALYSNSNSKERKGNAKINSVPIVIKLIIWWSNALG